MVAVRRRDEEPSVCVRREGGRVAAAELERGRGGAMVRVFCVWAGRVLACSFFFLQRQAGAAGPARKFHVGPGT